MTVTNPRICTRCGSATVDIPPVEVNLVTGSANTRRITLCDSCGSDFESFLQSPPRWAQLEPQGASGPSVDRSDVPPSRAFLDGACLQPR